MLLIILASASILVTAAVLGSYHLGALLQRRRSQSKRTLYDPVLEDTSHTVEIKARQKTVAEIRRLPLEVHSLDEVLRNITRKGAELLDADRVSVWGFVEKSTTPLLECACQFDAITHEYRSGEILNSTLFPDFYRALSSGTAVLAEDANTHPSSRELKDLYLKPHNIHSLLGTSILLGGRVEGLICHETVGRTRRWHWSDADLSETLGDTVALALDRSRRKSTEQALRRSQQRYRELIECTPIGVIIIDLTGIIVEANTRALKLLGAPSAEQLVGIDLSDFSVDNDNLWIRAQSVLSTGRPQIKEYRWTTRFGKQVHARVHFAAHVDETGKTEGVLTLLEDITEQRQTEEVMRHAQKLESLGLLASGVAHDFNNLLHVILGNAELAEHELPLGSSAKEHLDAVVAASMRASELTGSMLAYAGRGEMAKELVDLSETIGGTLDLLEHSISKRITLERDFWDTSLVVSCDVSQVHQIVMNLVLNGVEAHEDQPGTVRVSTQEQTLGPKELLSIPFGSLEPGDFAVLEVQDTGCGMEEEVLNRVFDPFFTTKFTGRGLGMAAVLGIVARHGGGLSVSSTPGKGSTFRILLPSSSEPLGDAEATPRATPPRAEPPLQTRPRVLLVEDEPEIAAMILQSLQRAEIHLDCAATLQAVGGLLEKSHYDAMILDLSLPRNMGEEILRALREHDHHIPVVVVSGHSLSEMEERCKGLEVVEYIQKPCSPSTLADRLMIICARHENDASITKT